MGHDPGDRTGRTQCNLWVLGVDECSRTVITQPYLWGMRKALLPLHLIPFYNPTSDPADSG